MQHKRREALRRVHAENAQQKSQLVNHAYRATVALYDEVIGDPDPMAAAANAWPVICSSYLGIEQTLKFLLAHRGAEHEPDRHPLEPLYQALEVGEKKAVSRCYRVFRSLHNFDSAGIDLASADHFIAYIGEGFKPWEYLLIEPLDAAPKMYVPLMLEVWRVLAGLADIRFRKDDATEYDYGYPRPVSTHLARYLGHVISEATASDEWQAGSEQSGLGFSYIHRLFCRETADGRLLSDNDAILRFGVDMFSAFATDQDLPYPVLVNDVLRTAARKAWRDYDQKTRFFVDAYKVYTEPRRMDLQMFYQRVRNGGLRWNAAAGEFE